MKIKSNGFRVTDICRQVDKIEVDGNGMARISFRTFENAISQYSEYMGPDEFAAFIDAGKVVLERMERKGDATEDVKMPPCPRPLRVVDRSGDVWYWRSDHQTYVFDPDDSKHDTCPPGSCGATLEHIRRNFGPVSMA